MGRSRVITPSVVKEGPTTYKIWYTGRQNDASLLGLLAIGYATSSDGIVWTKSGSNPVMIKNLSGFDKRGVGGAYIMGGIGSYTMYYAGFEMGTLHSEIGMATSADGLTWARQTMPVLQVGAGGSWEEKGVGGPSVLVIGSLTQMWYTGTNNDFLTEIGHASETLPVPPPPSTVPASSNTSIFAMIGGFALLIALLGIFGRGRLKQQRS